MSYYIFIFIILAASVVTSDKAKKILEKPSGKKISTLEAALTGIKKLLSKSSSANQTSQLQEDKYSPTSRPGPSFSHTSITQNLKAKTMKSPTPIMPSGHKRPAEYETKGIIVIVVTF